MNLKTLSPAELSAIAACIAECLPDDAAELVAIGNLLQLIRDLINVKIASLRNSN